MALTPVPLARTQLQDTATALYTSIDTKTVVTKCVATNTDAVSRTVTVYVVPKGGTAGTDSLIVSAFSIGAGQDVALTSLAGLVLSSGDALHAFASVTNVVNVHLSGFTP